MPQEQPTFVIQIRDLPDTFLESAQLALKNYATGLVVNGRFIGSGTFISWGRHFGILTAEHVTNHPDKALRCDFSGSNTNELQLMIADHPHYLGLQMRYLRNYTTGKRTAQTFGPDLSVIELPVSPQLSTIRAKKSFWPLTIKTNEKLKAALREDGCVMVAGHPAEGLQEMGSQSGFKEVCFVPGLVGATGRVRYFERKGFDYVEVGSTRNSESDAPGSYGGVSGGSLWHVPILRKKEHDNSKVFFKDFSLLGVPFYQSTASRPIKAGTLPKSNFLSVFSGLESIGERI